MMKKTFKYRIQNAIALVLSIACLLLVFVNFSGCADNNSSTDSNVTINTDKSITKSKAISIAKESSKVQNEIAAKYKMKFFYTPDWGTITAEENYSGGWDVVLKGTISGYTDDYKTDFEYDQKFTAKVTVSSSGYVSYVYVSTY